MGKGSPFESEPRHQDGKCHRSENTAAGWRLHNAGQWFLNNTCEKKKKSNKERETEDITPIAFFHLGLEKTHVTDAWPTLQPSGDLSGVTATWREGHGPERQVCDRAGGVGGASPQASAAGRW